MTSSISGSPLLDTDILVVNRGGVDYQTTRREVRPPISDLEELPTPRMPWDGYNGGIWHIKNCSETKGIWNVRGSAFSAYNADGTVISGGIKEINPGEDVVFLSPAKCNGLFATFRSSHNPSKQENATWEFGEYTNISKVQSLESAFRGNKPNGLIVGLENLDTSGVNNMAMCFADSSHNQDIGGWDVHSVGNMKKMFSTNHVFKQDLSRWDVSRVTNFEDFVLNAREFESNLAGWDVSSATNMPYMFSGASSFNSDLSGWCVTRIGSEPKGFADNTVSWTDPKPVWGTCP